MKLEIAKNRIERERKERRNLLVTSKAESSLIGGAEENGSGALANVAKGSHYLFYFYAL